MRLISTLLLVCISLYGIHANAGTLEKDAEKNVAMDTAFRSLFLDSKLPVKIYDKIKYGVSDKGAVKGTILLYNNRSKDEALGSWGSLVYNTATKTAKAIYFPPNECNGKLLGTWTPEELAFGQKHGYALVENKVYNRCWD